MRGYVNHFGPSLTMRMLVLVHEDDFVLTKNGLRQLSPPAPQQLWTI